MHWEAYIMKDFCFWTGVLTGAVIGMVAAAKCKIAREVVYVTEEKMAEAADDIRRTVKRKAAAAKPAAKTTSKKED